MHNLAIAMQKQGHKVSGSDDEIFEPSSSRLKSYGILPDSFGWFPEKIEKDIDAVIVGMHAKGNNPELVKAKELGLTIYSFPEFLYQHSKDKTRVVIGGSHGKTTITSMVMHVLKYCKYKFDYIVGAQIEGFDIMVNLTEEASIMIFEGDEYLTSPLDPRPKFHLYKPHLALISGIAWDHFNVFPTFENYVSQFKQFIELIEEDGCLVYYAEDPEIKKLLGYVRQDVKCIPYKLPAHTINEGKTYLNYDNRDVEIQIFGKHNLENIEGARFMVNQLGVSDKDFYDAIGSFRGASKRLQKLSEKDSYTVFLDFAHSPSKLEATIAAVKQQFPDRELIACMELHTYSSLNAGFLSNYRNTMNLADEALIYYNPHTVELKGLEMIDEEIIRTCFNREDIKVFTDSQKLHEYINNADKKHRNLLMMSSGNFNNILEC